MNEVANFAVIVNPQTEDVNAAIRRALPAVCLSQFFNSPTELVLTFGAYPVTLGSSPFVAPPPTHGVAGHKSQYEIYGLPPAAASFESGAQ